jgi:hypothetical protein
VTGQKGVFLKLALFQVFAQLGPVLQVITEHLTDVGKFQVGELLHDLFRGSRHD